VDAEGLKETADVVPDCLGAQVELCGDLLRRVALLEKTKHLDLTGCGRKFFGTFDSSTREYRVCVQVNEGDDPAAALGLESGTLPGGRYLRARLRGEPPGVYERIGPRSRRW
jgi:hypothetical protein